MTKYNITVINTISTENWTLESAVVSPIQVKSEAAMWNYLRQVRDSLDAAKIAGGVRAVVTTEDGVTFKDITFKMNSKGKIEMPNAVKETCRCRVAKVKAALKAQEEKKAKKREADRRYRERKKAAKAAAAQAADVMAE